MNRPTSTLGPCQMVDASWQMVPVPSLHHDITAIVKDDLCVSQFLSLSDTLLLKYF